MKLNIPTKYLATAILMALLGILALGWYLGAAKEKKVTDEVRSTLKRELQSYVVQLNDAEYNVTKVEQKLATERELRKQDVIDKETLRKLNIKNVNEISKLKLRIDTLLEDVNHNGQIIEILNSQIANKDSVASNNATTQKAILLPFDFQKKDQWLDLIGKFNRQGILNISLTMDVAVDAISGFDRTGKPTLNLLTDNKYIDVIDIKSYKTDVPKSKKYGIGIFAGYGINTKHPSEPAVVVGAGISYNPICF